MSTGFLYEGSHAPALRWLGMLFSLALTASSPVVSAEAARPAPMPEVMRSEHSRPSDDPFWIDANRVFTKDGQIDAQLLGPHETSYVSRVLATPERDGCIQAGEIFVDRIVMNGKIIRRTSLDETFGSAGVAIRGRVTGRSTGFEGTTAGTLIRFEPITIYKDNSRPQKVYYTFMPVGRFRVGNKTICKTDPNYAEVPEVGDEIVLLQPDDDRGETQYLDSYDGAGIVTIKRDGRLALPAIFRSDSSPQPLTTGKDFFRRLQAMVDAGPK